MKYQNAREVLPAELLGEVKKYAAGSLLYIPSEEADKLDRQMKHPVTEFRQSLLVRNQRIYNEYLAGKGITELADQYYLSPDTVKKTVYGKNKGLIPFGYDRATAAGYSSGGLSEEWVRTYLIRKTGNDGAYDGHWRVDGMVRFPIRLIDEAERPGYTVEEDEPLLIFYADHRFILHADRSVLAELDRMKVLSVPAFVIFEDGSDYPFYYENYGKPFSNGKRYFR